MGYADQPDFINAVALIETALPPQALMTELLAMEMRPGRLRAMQNGPRTLDLDMLLYENRVLDDSFVTLPHPRMHERAFVLAPLLDVAPDCDIPRHGSASSLLAACSDRNEVVRLENACFDWGIHTLRKLGKGLIAVSTSQSAHLH